MSIDIIHSPTLKSLHSFRFPRGPCTRNDRLPIGPESGPRTSAKAGRGQPPPPPPPPPPPVGDTTTGRREGTVRKAAQRGRTRTHRTESGIRSNLTPAGAVVFVVC